MRPRTAAMTLRGREITGAVIGEHAGMGRDPAPGATGSGHRA